MDVLNVLGGWSLLSEDASSAEAENTNKECRCNVLSKVVPCQPERKYEVAPDVHDSLPHDCELQMIRNIFRAFADADSILHDQQLLVATCIDVLASTLNFALYPRADEAYIILKQMKVTGAMSYAVFEVTLEIVNAFSRLTSHTVLVTIHPLASVGKAILESCRALAVQLISLVVDVARLVDDDALQLGSMIIGYD